MMWSKNPPTEPGWYWWRDDIPPNLEPIIAYIYADECGVLISKSGGEWSERIEAPNEQT